MYRHNDCTMANILHKMHRILRLSPLRDFVSVLNRASSIHSGPRPLKTGGDGAGNNLTNFSAFLKPVAFIANAKFGNRRADLHVFSHDANLTRPANGDCPASF